MELRRKCEVRMERLTKREKEIAKLVTEGFNNTEIAQKLYVSRHTIKAELSNIYEKLQIKNRVQLAIFCMKHGV